MAASSNESLDILESALDQAFSAPPPAVPQEVVQEESATESVSELTESSQFESVEEVSLSDSSVVEVDLSESTTSNDSWKEEYEAQVQSWRARSAEEREKAEKERLKWEAIRAIEKEEAAKRKAAGIVDELVVTPAQLQGEDNWENVKASSDSTVESTSSKVEEESSNAEAESAQVPSSPTPPSPSALPRTDSQPDTTTDESQKWEEVPSVTSSFPSMSFPDHIEDSSPAHREPAPPPAPVSVSLAIFDSTLSTRTRFTAFFSSLAVNLFLPFVNGVMLGFGEIFAKDVVMQWLGWKPSSPASSVANVGLRSSTRQERQKNALR